MTCNNAWNMNDSSNIDMYETSYNAWNMNDSPNIHIYGSYTTNEYINLNDFLQNLSKSGGKSVGFLL